MMTMNKNLNLTNKKETMKKLIVFAFTLALVVLSAFTLPAMLSGVSGLMLGAAFITFASEYNGQQTIDLILRPMFIGDRPDNMGIKIIYTNRAGSIKYPVFNTLSKVLMPYADGWQGGSGTTLYEKKFELEEFKAEVGYSKQSYTNTVLEWITNKGGIAQNDITGTTVLEAERKIFQDAINDDIRRIWWLGDKLKRHTAAGTYPNDAATAYAAGDLDKYYDVIDGIWTKIIADSATSPSSVQIKRTAMSNAAVKQAITYTLAAGSGGTVGFTLNGKVMSVTWTTGDTETATAIYTAYAAIALGMGVVITNPSAAALTFTAAIAGVPYTIGTFLTGGTSPLATWTSSASTANTVNAALTTDEAVTAFKAMYRNANVALLKATAKKELVIYATDSMIWNYEDTLSTSAYLESARRMIVDGISYMTWNGIPVIPMNIDTYLLADFPEQYPHRAILTVKNNFCLVLSSAAGFAETKFWFENKDNKNLQRTQFEMGAGYLLPELLSVVY